MFNVLRLFSGPVVVSRTGDVGTTISYAEASNSFANAPSVKALVHEDSRTVAMEVGIR